MKKKIHKILGVGLALVMVLSLGVALMPVNQAQAAEGNMTWGAQVLPTNTSSVLLNNSNVTDIAVAGDGTTIYAITGAAQTSTAPYALYKSTNAGQSFTANTALAGATNATAVVVGCVAVAPDDPDVVAVSVQDTPDRVWISTNGGVSWTRLPNFVAPADTATSEVQDLAVGPARSGSLYGRDYMAAIADTDTDENAGADVQIIGSSAEWASIAAAGLVPQRYDYMACQFSPYFAGDRSVAIIGADNQTAGGTGVHLQIIDTRTKTETRNVVLDANVNDLGASGSQIRAADIALPEDWDPTAGSGRVTWCSTASDNITNDSVYRVNDATVWDLSVGVTNTAWKSIAYSGTIDDGDLFAGAYTVTSGAISTNVKYATDPQLAQPTWKSTYNPPTGDGGLAVVRLDPNFAESNTVFVGTSGNESAFSVSYNAGVSYQQESLIDAGDTDVVAVDDINLVVDPEDNKILFMASDDGSELSLWKSSTPVSSTSWSRIYCFTDATGTGLIATSPSYSEDETLIFTNTVAGGRMYCSTNGGDFYSARYASSITTAVAAVAMADADVVYIGQGTTVYKSADTCRSYGAPVASNVTTLIISIDASAADLVLVGGSASCSYSTDGGASFARIAGGLAAAGNCYVVPDNSYADNSFIYCGGNGDAIVYRFEVGVSSAWESLLNTAAVSIMGVAQNNGVLYGMQTADCERTLTPTAQAGVIAWETADAGVPAATAGLFTAVDNHLYCADATVPSLDAYDDYLATAVPALTGPADGTVVSVDPVSGYAREVQLSWNVDSDSNAGNGLVNAYQIQIAVAGTDFAAPQSFNFEAVAATHVAGSTGGLNGTAPEVTVCRATGIWVTDLHGGTAYEWRTRARGEVAGDAIRSGWSEAGTFSVEASTGVLQPEYAGPVLQAPTPGAMGVSLTPGFSWAPVSNAVSYEFELSDSAATTAGGYFIDALVGKTGDNALVTAGWQCDVALEYGTSYFWHVKAITAGGGESVWGTAQFTTIDEAAVPVPPAPPVELPAPVTPAWIWAIVAIGAVLVIVVIVLIVVTRKP